MFYAQAMRGFGRIDIKLRNARPLGKLCNARPLGKIILKFPMMCCFLRKLKTPYQMAEH